MTRNIYNRVLRESVHDREARSAWELQQQARGNSTSSSFNKMKQLHNDDNETISNFVHPKTNRLKPSSYDPYNGIEGKIFGKKETHLSGKFSTPDTSLEQSYEKENPESEIALQFVPALMRDTSNNRRHRRQASSSQSHEPASWDAILQHEDEKKETESIFSPSTQRTLNKNQDAATTVSNGLTNRKVGGRIARLASMFTSRANVFPVDGNYDNISTLPNHHPEDLEGPSSYNRIISNNQASITRVLPTSDVPLSPAQSSGSSAYVGWPGTQDKRGNTIVNHSSYDDSSVGAPGSSSTNRSSIIRSVNCITSGFRSNRQTHDTAFHEGSSSKKSPEKCSSVAAYEDCTIMDESSSRNGGASRNLNHRRRNLSTCRSSPIHERSNKIHTSSTSDDDSSCYDDDPVTNAAEYHLAGAVADATKTEQPPFPNRQSLSALRYSKSTTGNETRQTSLSHSDSLPVSWKKKNLAIVDENAGTNDQTVRFEEAFPTEGPVRSVVRSEQGDQWEGISSVGGASTPDGSSIVSKTSLALAKKQQYLKVTANAHLLEVGTNRSKLSRFKDLQSAADETAIQLLKRNSNIRPPTEDSIAENNRLEPPHRSFSNAEGYKGLLDKTKEVPSLMDNLDSDSMSSSKATSVYSTNTAPNNIELGNNNGRKSIQQLSSVNEVPTRGILRNVNGSSAADADGDSDVFDGLSVAKESDVFDNIPTTPSPRKSRTARSRHYPACITEEDDNAENNFDAAGTDNAADDFKLVILPGGITTIQTTDIDYSNRRTASDYDDQLTSSEVSSNGYTRIPGYEEMIASGVYHDNSLHGINGNIGRNTRPANTRSVARSLVLEDITYESDSEPVDDDQSCSTNSANGLGHYYVKPSDTKKLVNAYREFSDYISSESTEEELEIEDDEHKAFALFEMRSRIMEKDIERGLERQGGTKVVDDIVTTAYNRAAHRIRDAVIVCKAWRDGASILDVVKASLLGRRKERTYYIKRRIRETKPRASSHFNDAASFVSSFSAVSSTGNFFWEAVRWLDDTDILQFRCPTLGSRHMRGFEIFSIGDCQSILLKLTNERCMELRQELNDATTRQIEAEEMLKEEGDNFQGELTEAEFEYLTAMEDVKFISKKLVQAEQAFALVRDRIKKLIAKYEAILMKIESNSSVVTYESSYYSECNSSYWDQMEQREREIWTRRAKRAEINAEIAAREALLAKQQSAQNRTNKQRELDVLKQKLQEVQSESSSHAPAKQNSAIIAKTLAMKRKDMVGPVHDTSKMVLESKRRINNDKIQDVKQRFRERMAAKKQDAGCPPGLSSSSYHRSLSPPKQAHRVVKDLFRSADEEMFQQMDFYERSLQAVDRTRA